MPLLPLFCGKSIPGQCTRLNDVKRRRDEHKKECFQHGGQTTSFPEDPCVRFTSIEKQVTYLLLLFQLQLSPWGPPSIKYVRFRGWVGVPPKVYFCVQG